MPRWLALWATLAVACSGHAPPPTPPGDGHVRLAPARDDGAADDPPPAPLDAAAPRPLDQDLPRLAARALQMVQAIRDALDAAGADCGAATAKLTELQRTYADVIAANAVIARADRKAELAAALAPQQAALDDAAAALFRAPALGTCADQPTFAAALDHALGAPLGSPP